MKTKISQAVIGGIVATLAMTMVMFIAPYMGLPKMNAAAMLSMMMGVPVLIGWGLHFMIGIVFALAYVFLFVPILKKVRNRSIERSHFRLNGVYFRTDDDGCNGRITWRYEFSFRMYSAHFSWWNNWSCNLWYRSFNPCKG